MRLFGTILILTIFALTVTTIADPPDHRRYWDYDCVSIHGQEASALASKYINDEGPTDYFAQATAGYTRNGKAGWYVSATAGGETRRLFGVFSGSDSRYIDHDKEDESSTLSVSASGSCEYASAYASP